MIKDSYVLEFLGLPELPEYSESELESKIIDHLQQFLLELGTGFAFVPENNTQIFASKYETVLPSKEVLQKLLDEQMAED